MAEVTSMRNNALPYPVYGVAYVVTFPLLDADGDPVSPSSPDSEVSKNGDTFTDCTNEAVEIATSSGICYLILTSTEMTADIVTVRIQSTGAKTTVLTLYPRKLPILSTGTCQGANDTSDIQLASGDSAVDDTYNGCLCVAVIDTVTEARIINDYAGSTKVGEVSPAWNTAAPDATDTYTIYLPEGRQVPTVNTTHVSGTSQTAGDIIADTNDIQTRLPAALVSGRMDSNMQAAANNVITAAVIATDAIDADALAADAIAEINATVDAALADVRLDELLSADSDIDGAAPPTVGSVFHELLSKTAGSFTYDQTTDSLEALRDRGDAAWITATGFSTHSASDVWAVATRVLTAATNISGPIADQVWEETLADHSGTAGSTAAALNAAGSAGDPWATALPGAYGAGTAGRLIGRSLPDVVAGNAGGLLIAGSNAATTFATLTVTTNAIAWNSNWDAEVQSEVDDALAAVLYIRTATAQSGNSSSIQLDAGASASDGAYHFGQIWIKSGTGAGQSRVIYSYTGSNKVALVSPDWDTNPASDSVFVILPGGASYVANADVGIYTSIASYVWTITGTRTITGGTITTYTGNTPQTGDSFARLTGTGAVTFASLSVTGTTTLSGAVSLGSTLGVTGTVTFNALTVTNATTLSGAVSMGSTLGVTGTVTFNAFTVTNALTVGSSNLATAANVSAVMTTAMTEAYAADGVAPTPAQAMFAILQRTTEFSIAGTTITVKKLDGSTTAFTLTLDDATSPTSSTRAT